MKKIPRKQTKKNLFYSFSKFFLFSKEDIKSAMVAAGDAIGGKSGPTKNNVNVTVLTYKKNDILPSVIKASIIRSYFVCMHAETMQPHTTGTLKKTLYIDTFSNVIH